MIRLVVNADDLGLSPEIDAGIFDAARNGIVTSASILVAGRSFESARLQLGGSGLGVGVHLAAVGGLPPAAGARVPELCEDGKLPQSWGRLIPRLVRRPRLANEILTEFGAQLAQARDAGIAIDHVDAHQHVHMWPSVFRGVLELCRQFGIRALRVPDERPTLGAFMRPSRAAAMTPLWLLSAWERRSLGREFRAPRFWGLYDGGALDRRALLRTVEALPEGDHEIGCHPGRGVQGVPEDPEWRYRWDAERIALCDPALRKVLERRGIQLVRFSDLAST